MDVVSPRVEPEISVSHVLKSSVKHIRQSFSIKIYWVNQVYGVSHESSLNALIKRSVCSQTRGRVDLYKPTLLFRVNNDIITVKLKSTWVVRDAIIGLACY